MHTTGLSALVAICFLASWTSPLRSQTAPATQPASALSLKTERIVIFKDGYGLAVKTGKATADADGRAFTEDVPDAAVLGTFWAVGDDERRKVVGMRAQWVERNDVEERPSTCVSVVELLRANVGKSVTLELTDRTDKGEPRVEEGTIAELLQLPGELTTPQPAQAVYSRLYRGRAIQLGGFSADTIAGPEGGTLEREIVPRGADLVVLKKDDRQIVMPVARVQAVRGANLSTAMTRKYEVLARTKRLSFEFGPELAGKDVSLRLMYFTPGLRWIPTYRLSGELKDKGELALQGEVINDVTDIEHAALDLVVGVPNFRFESLISPLTLEGAMRAALASSGGPYLGNNGIMSNSFAMDSRGRAGGAAIDLASVAAGIPEELRGNDGEQDLYVYPIKDFSLKKGGRATVPLWQQTASLQHVYVFNARTKRGHSDGSLLDSSLFQPQGGQGGMPATRSPQRVVVNQVWHQFELANSSGYPWTTGTALIMRDQLPLGQELLIYTPPGGRTMLPVTVSLDLRGTINEEETGRAGEEVRYNGDVHPIQKKGTITLSSFRKEKATVRITLSIGGKVTAASDNGQIRIDSLQTDDWDNGGGSVNNHSDVTWEVTVDPGKTATVTYDVGLYTY